jgi:uncharacterized protein
MKFFILILSACLILSGAVMLHADPNSSLSKAIVEKNIDAARSALKSGAKVNAKDYYFLHQACSGGSAEIARLLIDNKINVNQKSPDGETGLMIALGYPVKTELIRMLIKAGADVNAANKAGLTPLMLVAQNMIDVEQYAEVATELIKSKARPDDKDAKGMTALMWASGQGSPAIAKILIAAGADVNVKDSNGMTALMFAANFSQKESVEALIGAGAKVNEQDTGGWSALLHAIKGAFEPDMVNYLISKGAAVNIKAAGGWTPLMEAASKGKPEIVRSLLKAKAEVNARSDEGRTATGYASMMIMDNPDNPFKQVVGILKNAGGK